MGRAIQYPQRFTYLWLIDALPRLTSAAEFEALIDALERKGWSHAEPGTNFHGLMFWLLAPDVRREIRALEE